MDRKRLLKTTLSLLLAFTMTFAPLFSSYSAIAFAAGNGQETAANAEAPAEEAGAETQAEEAVPGEEAAPVESEQGSVKESAEPSGEEEPDGEEGPAAEEKADVPEEAKPEEEAETPAKKISAEITVKETAEDTVRISVDNPSSKEEDFRIYLWKDDDSFTDGTDKDKVVREADDLLVPKDLDKTDGTVQAGDIKLKYVVEKDNGKAENKYLEFTAKANEKAEFEIAFEPESSLNEKYSCVAEIKSDTLDADDVLRTALLTINASKTAAPAKPSRKAAPPLKAGNSISLGESVTVTKNSAITVSFTPEITHEYKFSTTPSTSYLYYTLTCNDPADNASVNAAGTLTRVLKAGLTYTIKVDNRTSTGRDVTLEYGTHDYGEPVWSSEETCTEAGKGVETCKSCGTEHDTAKAPLGHDWDENGVCRRCGTHGIKAVITLVFQSNSDKKLTGFTLDAHPSLEEGKYSAYAVSAAEEIGEGKYAMYLDPSDAADGKFSVFVTDAPEDYYTSTTTATNAGFGIIDTTLAEDNVVNVTISVGRRDGFGPVYIDAYVYDSITEKPLSNVKLLLQKENWNSDEQVHKWIPNYDSSGAFQESGVVTFK